MDTSFDKINALVEAALLFILTRLLTLWLWTLPCENQPWSGQAQRAM